MLNKRTGKLFINFHLLSASYRYANAIHAVSVKLGYLIFLFPVFMVLSGCLPASREDDSDWVSLPNTSREPTVTPTPMIFILPSVTTVYVDRDQRLSTVEFSDPAGLFSIQAPAGWEESAGSSGAVFWSPDRDHQLSVQVINTGYDLNEQSLIQFIRNNEDANAQKYDSYVEVDRQNGIQDHSIFIRNSFYIQEQQKTSFIYYQAIQNRVVIIELWANEKDAPEYQDFFEDIYSSFVLNEANFTTQPFYLFDPSVLHSNGYFSIAVPQYWEFHRTESDFTSIETFTSPDEQAVIQTIVYDDGEEMTKSIAGDVVLALLQNNYTTQIQISQDEVLSDGREKMTWHALDGSIQGVTAFSTHGTGIYILTALWGNDPDRHYQDMIDRIFSSYNPETRTEG